MTRPGDLTCDPDEKITADVKLINENVCKMWLRCSPLFSSYRRKTTGGGGAK